MADFSKAEQLLALIERFPQDPVDIEGIILDYIGETQSTLDKVLDANPDIYRKLFLSGEREAAFSLLKSTVQDEITKERLIEECRNIYPVISQMLTQLQTKERIAAKAETKWSRGLERIVGFSPVTIIWQISDIHFGPYNLLEKDPGELAALLARTAQDFKYLKPDLVFISGDISSRASEDEFGNFLIFCNALNKGLLQIEWVKMSPKTSNSPLFKRFF